MKRMMTLILTAGLLFGAATGASAIDFKAKGQWIFGFGMVDTNYTPRIGGVTQGGGDTFAALQRVRLQLDAVASDFLSGTVYFEIGDQAWGCAADGGALGTDGMRVQVKRAYIDWLVPNTALQVRMGLQGLAQPSVAGGPAIFDDDAAGIALDYKFNDMVSLTFVWARPYNDNIAANNNPFSDTRTPAGYLDNLDLFVLALPVSGEGWKVTPWFMYGIMGVNTLPVGTSADFPIGGLHSTQWSYALANGLNAGMDYRRNSSGYTNMFWVGLPIAITAFDPWNFELDMNYGYVASTGRYNATRLDNNTSVRAHNERSGWLIKGLAEYKMDWGTPGIFAWYGSGDQSNPRNGSQRMPAVSPCGNFTSFIGDGNERGWSIWNRSGNNFNFSYDQMLSYSGTWGIGLQLKDISFFDGLSHTFRVAYWGGTNSAGMAKYLPASGATISQGSAGFYLTTNDYLVEFNLDSTYTIYENLTATLELGYIVNGVDRGTWNRFYRPVAMNGIGDGRISQRDAYKAALVLNYSF